ncbi:MAG: YdeI/OmpD-associated family protein [Sphingobacteriaceae bacterium]|nr:YdeI/OmpD-associated family protein [Sphingobacteriaceae bacterium]
MVIFDAEIERFDNKGEKTGWYYVFVPQQLAHKIKPNEKRSFRVKGSIDKVLISGLALLPMGEGDFILVLNLPLRKKINKTEGSFVKVNLAFDADFKIEMPEDLQSCLAAEAELLERFLKLNKGHQNYFINWLNTAKTENTRTKRIVMIVEAMENKFDFPQMIRSAQNKR